MWIRQGILAFLFCTGVAIGAQAAELPDGFVYLRDIVPDIQQDMRYASNRNFMRKRLPGYGAAECVLTEAAAKALGKVQGAAVKSMYTLVVFDCYRPQGAVDAMVDWVGRGQGTDPDYYPNVPRSELVRQGYIGARSSHARGSTVDVGLDLLTGRTSRENSVCSRRDRSTLDLGTPFDCFDPASRTGSRAVSAQAQTFRNTLVDLMRLGGFKNYPGEWWHFTLQGEPYPTTSFSFRIEPR